MRGTRVCPKFSSQWRNSSNTWRCHTRSWLKAGHSLSMVLAITSNLWKHTSSGQNSDPVSASQFSSWESSLEGLFLSFSGKPIHSRRWPCRSTSPTHRICRLGAYASTPTTLHKLHKKSLAMCLIKHGHAARIPFKDGQMISFMILIKLHRTYKREFPPEEYQRHMSFHNDAPQSLVECREGEEVGKWSSTWATCEVYLTFQLLRSWSTFPKAC